MKFTTIVILLGCSNQQECKQSLNQNHNSRDNVVLVSSSDNDNIEDHSYDGQNIIVNTER